MPRRLLLPALALATALAGAASAQTSPTPEQARSLEAQITAWLKQVTAGSVPLPDRPVELTAEGDHYLVRVPFGRLGKVQPPDAAFTAKARALDGTRWALDDQQFPPNMSFTTIEAVPDAADAKDPSPNGTHNETVTYAVKLGQQDVHGVFDPTYSSPTNNSGTIASFDMTKTGGVGPSTTHIGRFTSQSSTQPIDAGHVNLLVDGSAEGYSIKADMPDNGSFSLEAKRLHLTSAVSGVAHNQMVPVIQSFAALGRLAGTKTGSEDGLSPAEKATLRTLLQKAHALLTGGKVDESLEDIKFDFSGTTGSIGKVEIAFGGDAPQDMLTSDMTFSLDGLKVDGLPPNFADYMPTHISLHPTVSNVSVAALTKMGMDATAPAQPGKPATPPDADLKALFAHGGINVGFDHTGLEIAGTTLAATGKFVIANPNSVNGQAEFTAHGLDALVTKMQADPMLAQGVPVVIFLKGIARTTADQSVWQVTVNNTKVLVNGVDLSAMAAGFSK